MTVVADRTIRISHGAFSAGLAPLSSAADRSRLVEASDSQGSARPKAPSSVRFPTDFRAGDAGVALCGTVLDNGCLVVVTASGLAFMNSA